jgi:predicted metal-dependent hydrolase
VQRRRRTSSKRKVEHYRATKEVARAAILARLVELNASYGFIYKKVSIRNQRSRWGSCSKAGNLNFNYAIHALPPHLMDYVIVHELCHLSVFNHSRAFWDLVAQALPNYQTLRAELRQYGHLLR